MRYRALTRSPVAAGLAMLMALQSACGAGWKQPAVFPTGALPPRQQAQVWMRGRVLQLHAIRASADSLSGVPFIRSIDCDSCRVQVARSAIDSLRVGDPAAGFWSTVAVVVMGPVLLMGLLCVTAHACFSPDY